MDIINVSKPLIIASISYIKEVILENNPSLEPYIDYLLILGGLILAYCIREMFFNGSSADLTNHLPQNNPNAPSTPSMQQSSASTNTRTSTTASSRVSSVSASSEAAAPACEWSPGATSGLTCEWKPGAAAPVCEWKPGTAPAPVTAAAPMPNPIFQVPIISTNPPPMQTAILPPMQTATPPPMQTAIPPPQARGADITRLTSEGRFVPYARPNGQMAHLQYLKEHEAELKAQKPWWWSTLYRVMPTWPVCAVLVGVVVLIAGAYMYDCCPDFYGDFQMPSEIPVKMPFKVTVDW